MTATLHIWYLDDGTLVGPRSVVASIMSQIRSQGIPFGLILNLNKCEVYWPSGDQDFTEFPPEVIRLVDGISLLGSPIWDSLEYLSSCIAKLVSRVESIQLKILELDGPQVELNLVRLCAGTCKINHVLRTVPADAMLASLHGFDASLRFTLSKISQSPI